MEVSLHNCRSHSGIPCKVAVLMSDTGAYSCRAGSECVYNNSGKQRQAGPHENGLKPMSAFAVSGVDGIGILQEKLLLFPWEMAQKVKN